MTRGFKEEFETVQLLVSSKTKTGRTDAFIISFTKMEKQVRRIFTYMVYQFPAFNLVDYKEILSLIASKRFLYFENFIKGFNALYPRTFEKVVGTDIYNRFKEDDFPRIKMIRNKVLHGQPTGKNLSADDLKMEIGIIQKWCLQVAESMLEEIGFDGFQWNSFRKNRVRDLASVYKVLLINLQELEAFIDEKMK